MNTPLQHAAWAVIARWDSPAWKDMPHTGEYIAALRKALAAEQAQAVEPMPTSIRRNRTEQEFKFGMEVLSWNRKQTDPPIDAGRELWVADEVLKLIALNNRPAPPEAATGERAELVARLRDIFKNEWGGDALMEAADMLEADGKAQQVAAPAQIMPPADMVFQIALLQELADVKQTLLSTEGQLGTSQRMLGNLQREYENLEPVAQQVAVLTDIEQYRMQMAGISTAALGYWSEGDDINPDYDTPALRDVVRLYEKYDQLFKEKEARRAQQVAVLAWAATADKMPEPLNKVLAFNGKKQPIRAMWVPAKTLEDSGDGDFGEYDEATDQTYWPEGWYETNAYEETHWLVGGQVTHWMPLPAAPQGAKP